MKFTQNEILNLQLGEKRGPFLATRREIHRAQANLSNHKAKYVGSEFTNYSEQATGLQPDGSTIKLKGWFNFFVERTAIGVSADTGEPEPIRPV